MSLLSTVVILTELLQHWSRSQKNFGLSHDVKSKCKRTLALIRLVHTMSRRQLTFKHTYKHTCMSMLVMEYVKCLLVFCNRLAQ